MSFLNLCNGIDLWDNNKLTGVGEINFHNYKDFIFRNSNTLLIEGIHQYSSLLAEKFYGRESYEAFVPAIIRHMDTYNVPYSSTVKMEGCVNFDNNFFQVNSKLTYLLNNKETRHGKAEVFLKRLPVEKINTNENTFYYGKDLIYIKQSQFDNKNYIINFKINGYQSIFREHFPGHPICPASIIIEFVHEIAGTLLNRKEYKIVNTKFIASLTTSNDYYLYLTKNANGITFHIMDEQKNRMVTGSLN